MGYATAMTARVKAQKNRSRTEELSDRERIAIAVGELVDRGYATMPSWRVCCSNCGWAEIGKSIGINWRDEEFPDDFKAIWWHEQGDSLAFADDAGMIPQTASFLEQLAEHEDDDDDDSWFEQHMEEAEADSIIARLTEFNTLLRPLYVHWLGNSTEIAAALRAQGLRVQVPSDDSKCIVVLPMETAFSAQAINGEVVLEIDGDEVQLSAGDTRRLIRKLTRAARLAESQMPSL